MRNRTHTRQPLIIALTFSKSFTFFTKPNQSTKRTNKRKRTVTRCFDTHFHAFGLLFKLFHNISASKTRIEFETERTTKKLKGTQRGPSPKATEIDP